ncbi:MAG TPA: N-acyl homoserine lactonase family protein [Gemmatimonadaceae bacterium]|nr:N-acyl homoserine lactonase family protein [Gemmatimonadaceae bacterium]
MTMIYARTTLLLATAVAAAAPATAQTASPVRPDAVVTLARLACGTPGAPSDVGRFSDTYKFTGLKVQLTYSCYLVRHGDDYMVWDTGFAPGAGPTAPKTSLADLVAQTGVKPEQVKYVAVSHYHGDHVGQLAEFPQSTLLIGKGDWDIVSDPKAAATLGAPFAHWVSGGGKVDPVSADRDVFGDGTVVMLDMPGHTPGHHSLLVRLKGMGPVLISGDVSHFHENYDADGVPTFNTNRASSLASLARFKDIAANLHATVIIQHDARDVGKLPAFPEAAK